MTAIAGCWDWRGDDASRRSRAIAAALRSFGGAEGHEIVGPEIALWHSSSNDLPEESGTSGITELADGGLLAADIRLDDREDTAALAGVDGERARSLSDAGLIAAGWARRGPAILDAIYGDFALAAWGPATRTLTLARDFTAQRPLFFARGPGWIAWSSMPSGLHALDEVPVEPDVDDLARLLNLHSEAANGSYFRGIEKVPPGVALTFTTAGRNARVIWNPPDKAIRFARDEDYVEAMRERLDRAVASRLRRSSGGVASHLSSGLDSGAVTATAARLLDQSGERLDAFTAVPGATPSGGMGHELPNEGPLAASTARARPNIDHHLVPANGAFPFDTAAEDAVLFQRPTLNPINFVWLKQILDSAKAEGTKVLLTGARGNLGFSYSGIGLLPSLARRGAIGRLLREARALRAEGMTLGSLAAATVVPLMPGAIADPLYRAVQRLRGRDARSLALPAAPATDLLNRSSVPGQQQARRVGGILGVDYGNYHHGMLAGWGIDVRDPMSDRRLIEFCLAVPDEQFLRGGVQRSLARRSLADRLPGAVLAERGKGYQAADWAESIRGRQAWIAAQVRRFAADPDLKRLLDVDRMAILVERWPDDWSNPALRYDYRLELMRALAVGTFALQHWQAAASKGKNA